VIEQSHLLNPIGGQQGHLVVHVVFGGHALASLNNSLTVSPDLVIETAVPFYSQNPFDVSTPYFFGGLQNLNANRHDPELSNQDAFADLAIADSIAGNQLHVFAGSPWTAEIPGVTAQTASPDDFYEYQLATPWLGRASVLPGLNLHDGADLSLAGAFAVEGRYAKQRISSAVNVGDINRDGFDDLLVTGYAEDGTTPRSWLINGPFDLHGITTVEDFASQTWTETGAPAATIPALDLNGDGQVDVVANTDTQVTITLGGADAPDLTITAATITGTVQTLSWNAGDYDGDTRSDLAILRSRSVGGQPVGGVLHVFFDVLQHPAEITLSDADVRVTSTATTGILDSLSNSAFFDVNADGYDDLLAGAATFDATTGTVADQAGRLYVLYGSGNPSVLPTDHVEILANRVVTGSGEFVVNRATGRPEQFAPGNLDTTARENWYQFTTLGDGLPGNYLEVDSPPLPLSPLAAVAAGTHIRSTSAITNGDNVAIKGGTSDGVFEFDLSPLIHLSGDAATLLESVSFDLDYTVNREDYPEKFKLAPEPDEASLLGKTSAAIGETLYFSADDPLTAPRPFILWKSEG
ncbi:MAG: VCBS repeat-containing protein, partial [Planctomycetaceae bacterium]